MSDLRVAESPARRPETHISEMSHLLADTLANDEATDRPLQDSVVNEYEAAILAEEARSVSDCRIQPMLLASLGF
jgi:hypothetical protein